jgi:hypothetical protein
MKRLVLLILLAIGLNSCTVEDTTTSSSSPSTPINPNWTGTVVTQGFAHSMFRQYTISYSSKKDTLYQDSNSKNTVYAEYSSTIKIGKTRDSLTTGEIVTYSPQNGFIVFDLVKEFGGKVTNIRTANLKVKLYQKTGYTNDLKFVVSILDTTILAKTDKERISAVQSSTGESGGYLTELSLDIKGNFSSSGKIVIGIKAENAEQTFASIQYCKIEFDGDIRTASSSIAR